MRFSCPSCSAELYTSDEEEKRSAIRCPDCSTVIQPDEASGAQVSQPQTHPTKTPVSKVAGSLKSLFPGNSRRMNLLLYGSVFTYLIGIIWPLMTIEKKLIGIPIKGETVSLLSGLIALFDKGDVLLFLIIFTFSIAFPIGKLIVLYRLWYHPYTKDRCGQLTHRLAVFGKWSMLDVMVVGLLVVIVKIKGMVSVQVHAGVYFFAVSVITTMILSAWIGKMLASRKN